MIIPNITTTSGMILTMQDWLYLGVEEVYADLAALLTKPGYDVLKQLGPLKRYWGWQGKLTLNINQVHTIRSPFNGEKLRFSEAEIDALVSILKPDTITHDETVRTNPAAEDAIAGLVYTNEGKVSLQDVRFEKDFQVLDDNCVCEACSQGLTRAYLHHLYQATPLLCKRWLVMHNYARSSD